MGMLRNAVEETRNLVSIKDLNNPSVPMYKALANALAGGALGFTGRPELPQVTYDTSMAIGAVYRATALVAGTIASLPLHVYDVDRETGQRTVVWSESERFIWGRPNVEQARTFFWMTAIVNMLLMGNAYIYRSPADAFARREIYLIHPQRVRVIRNRAGEKVFVIDDDEDRPMRPTLAGGEICHIPNVSLDGFTGVSVVKAARLGLQLARAAEEFGANVFVNGSVPGGVLETDADLDDTKANKLIARWEKYHKGYEKAHRIAILDNGAKYKPIGITPEDAQYLDSRRFQVTEIARWFGVPPHLLGDVQTSTTWGTGLEQQSRGFVTYTLRLLIKLVEDAITDELLIARGQRRHYAKFDLSALLRADTVSRYQAYALARQWGWMSADDIRALEDMPPLPNGAGDVYLTPLNMASANGDPGVDTGSGWPGIPGAGIWNENQ